jgi:amidophosphoribosyltransferase
VFLRGGELPVRGGLRRATTAPCVFEFIYFARPDSVMEGRSVYEVRLAMGRQLGERIRSKRIAADVVVPVPDTARPAAAALAETLGLPLREGFIKNRYTGRTFIMPDALSRQAALRLKLNPLPGELAGRRVLLVDDSIVRGTTLHRVLGLLRDVGAAEVHLAVHSPPVRHPCFYGIDMSTEGELFARGLGGELDELERSGAAALGADSLTYLEVDGLDRAFPGARCAACFDGRYPQAVAAADRDAIARDRAVTR